MSGHSSILIAAEGVRQAHGWLGLWKALLLAGGGRWRGCEVVSGTGVMMFHEGDVTSPEFEAHTPRCSVRIAGATGLEVADTGLLADALEEAAERFSRIDKDLARWRIAGGPEDAGALTAVIDNQMRYVSVSEALADWHKHSVSSHIGRTLREVIGVIAECVEPVVREVLVSGEERLVVFSGGVVNEAGQVLQAHYSPVTVGTQTLCRAEIRPWVRPDDTHDVHALAISVARTVHLREHVSAAVRWETPQGVYEVDAPSEVVRRAVREALRGCARSRTCVVSSRVVGDDLAMVFRAGVLDPSGVTPEVKALVSAHGGAVFVADDIQLRFPLRADAATTQSA